MQTTVLTFPRLSFLFLHSDGATIFSLGGRLYFEFSAPAQCALEGKVRKACQAPVSRKPVGLAQGRWYEAKEQRATTSASEIPKKKNQAKRPHGKSDSHLPSSLVLGVEENTYSNSNTVRPRPQQTGVPPFNHLSNSVEDGVIWAIVTRPCVNTDVGLDEGHKTATPGKDLQAYPKVVRGTWLGRTAGAHQNLRDRRTWKKASRPQPQ
ncbi:hypothetical protein PM082_020831 [Marasmius tenuissimus]|nr:hypothetical protein PM082_020831 [Marasmius tenuissimus]